ncbi:uncharacterized protein J3R85_003842 [Psidium guajava]|nr:uncharacterized protein J3R85_003842 [Psidium guajava]
MDQNDNLMKVRNVHRIHNKKNSHFLKRALTLVLSISLLSFVMCYSSGYALPPHSFDVQFSTVLFSIFTLTLERKFMFLVCNGILAFLLKSSSSSSGSSPSGSDLDADDEVYKNQDGEEEIKVSVPESSEVEGVTAENVFTIADSEYGENNLALAAEEEEEDEEEEEEEEEKLRLQGQDKEEEDEGEQHEEQMLQETEFANTGAEEENETWVVEEDDRLSKQEEEELEECGYTRKKTESPPVATGNEEMMSTDELNKKFEEFIRKMKEEIRVEAKSQLIAV